MDKPITTKFIKGESKVFAFPFEDDDDFQTFSLRTQAKTKGKAEYCFSAGAYKGLAGQIVCKIQNTEKETITLTRNEIGGNNGSEYLFLTIFVSSVDSTDVTFTLSSSNQINNDLFIFGDVWTTIAFAIIALFSLILLIFGMIFISRKLCNQNDQILADREELVISPEPVPIAV